MDLDRILDALFGLGWGEFYALFFCVLPLILVFVALFRKPFRTPSDPERVENFVNASSMYLSGLQMCRITMDYDEKKKADMWLEARLITTQGEKPICRVHFWSEAHNASFMSTFSFGSHDRETKEYIEQINKAHARLIAYMLQDGWEPASYGQGQVVTMKKRF